LRLVNVLEVQGWVEDRIGDQTNLARLDNAGEHRRVQAPAPQRSTAGLPRVLRSI